MGPIKPLRTSESQNLRKFLMQNANLIPRTYKLTLTKISNNPKKHKNLLSSFSIKYTFGSIKYIKQLKERLVPQSKKAISLTY